jgi:hypothetical protein
MQLPLQTIFCQTFLEALLKHQTKSKRISLDVFSRQGTLVIPSKAYAQLKDIKCPFNCGSGFLAAIRHNAVGADRGWKAAPTINKFLT